MDTTKTNTSTTTHNAGFPPVPPKTHQGARGNKPLSLSAQVKALNGSRGRGSYFVRVKWVREFNEIQIRLTDGTCTRATAFVDVGHTAEDRRGAVQELTATVQRFLAV